MFCVGHRMYNQLLLFAIQMRVQVDSNDKLSGTEYGDNYTSHWAIEVIGNMLIRVGLYTSLTTIV